MEEGTFSHKGAVPTSFNLVVYGARNEEEDIKPMKQYANHGGNLLENPQHEE